MKRGLEAGAVIEGTVSMDAQQQTFIAHTLPVRVSGCLPGERVRVRIAGAGAHKAVGTLLEVLEPSAHRVAPVCPLLAVCGSCDLMMASPAWQLQHKAAQVTTALAPFPGDRLPIQPAPSTEGYRARARFTCGGQPGQLLLGAYAAGSHTLIDLEGCPVTAPSLLTFRDGIQQVLSASGLPPYQEQTGVGVLRHLSIQLDPAAQRGLLTLVLAARFPGETRLAEQLLDAVPGLVGVWFNLQDQPGNALLGPVSWHGAGAERLPVSVGDVVLQLPGAAFSQVHLEAAGQLYRRAVEWLEPYLQGDSTAGALDLFCGAGALALQLGKRVAWGLGVEWTPAAIDSARLAAADAGLHGWTFEAGDVEAVLSGYHAPGPVTVATINPPRRGAGPGVLARVVALAPRAIVYVSCLPASLARDAVVLAEAGYLLRRAQPFDLFPHTHHVETLALFERPR